MGNYKRIVLVHDSISREKKAELKKEIPMCWECGAPEIAEGTSGLCTRCYVQSKM